MSAPMVLLSITPVACLAAAAVIRKSSDAIAVFLATAVALFSRDRVRARRAVTVLRLFLNARARIPASNAGPSSRSESSDSGASL